MQTEAARQALDDVKAFFEKHAAAYADHTAARLRDKRGPELEAELLRTADGLRAMMLLSVTPAMAGGISKAFVAMVGERLTGRR